MTKLKLWLFYQMVREPHSERVHILTKALLGVALAVGAVYMHDKGYF